VADATELAQKFTVQEEGQLGNLQDADLARAALELTQAQTQQQATLSVAANVQKAPNLFTYLA
jgi:flagellin-like hook-associated protein FlgL